ncbi:MAG: PTS sugar transporter subunit IIB [Candidatus Krumholzibacteriota bacterium]|nr:PTS sugar transporter subunit IIB [Candidatus Krumholzibacteriota bacterium]
MLLLFRIDDRLVHAQVVLGWGRKIRPERIIVADDEVAADKWESDLYLLAAPPGVKISLVTLVEAVDQFNGAVFDSERVILLVRNPASAFRLIKLGLGVGEVNVGGMHYHDGKEKILDNIYIDDEDRKALREMVKLGITLDARALPDDEKIILNSRIV